jgi:hypothetical protein
LNHTSRLSQRTNISIDPKTRLLIWFLAGQRQSFIYLIHGSPLAA